MKWSGFPSVLCALLVVGVTADTYDNYCFYKCGGKHIACNNVGVYGKKCPANTRQIGMRLHRSMILSLHNEIRNRIAGGSVSYLKPAGRMPEMQWDHELAALALLNAKTCLIKRDECHNTERFPYSGQNIAMFGYKGYETDYQDEYIIRKRIQGWYGEVVNVTANYIERYPRKKLTSIIGHFTLMINERSTHIGCGAVRYTKNKTHRFLFTCNYSAHNFRGEHTYTTSQVAGSNCRSGKSPIYSNLCHKNELHD